MRTNPQPLFDSCVKAMLKRLQCWTDGNLNAKSPKPWTSNQEQKRIVGLAVSREILQALPDQFVPW
jgi:hypothetical protein